MYSPPGAPKSAHMQPHGLILKSSLEFGGTSLSPDVKPPKPASIFHIPDSQLLHGIDALQSEIKIQESASRNPSAPAWVSNLSKLTAFKGNGLSRGTATSNQMHVLMPDQVSCMNMCYRLR